MPCKQYNEVYKKIKTRTNFRVPVIFMHPYIDYALSAARNSPLLSPKLIPAPHFLYRGVSVAQGNRHTP